MSHVIAMLRYITFLSVVRILEIEDYRRADKNIETRRQLIKEMTFIKRRVSVKTNDTHDRDASHFNLLSYSIGNSRSRKFMLVVFLPCMRSIEGLLNQLRIPKDKP